MLTYGGESVLGVIGCGFGVGLRTTGLGAGSGTSLTGETCFFCIVIFFFGSGFFTSAKNSHD